MVVFPGGGSDSKVALPVLRVSPGAGVLVAVQSRTSFQVGTHFQGRPFLCPGQDCPACPTQDARWRCFVVVRGLYKSEGGTVAQNPWLLETSAARWPWTLEDETENTLTGRVVQVSRRKSKGVLSVSPTGEIDKRVPVLPEWPELVSAVGRLFGLRAMSAIETFEQWQEMAREESVKRLLACLRKND